jgi:diguanylate cyclase (GGDEF)-like protein
MHLDNTTLFVVTGFMSVVAGLLLLFSWLQDRRVTALALWGLAFICVALGQFVVMARGPVPDALAMKIGPVLALVGYGLMWCGARRFEGRQCHYHWALIGAVTFLVASQFDAFTNTPVLRIQLNSAFFAVYSLLAASEVWRGRDPGLLSRWPAMVLLLLHAIFFVVRIAFADQLPFPAGNNFVTPGWFPIGALAVLANNFCLAFLIMNMAKERAELRYRNAALVDPLTGAANRRAFFDRGERLLQRARAEGKPAAVLLLDLDLFKTINDTFGHETGDRVLCAFCNVATETLRPTDVFARLGGEEFACLLPGASAAEALRVAERVRATFEGRPAAAAIPNMPSTVSVGVATTLDVDGDLSAMLAAADRALYDAKAKGRNRVEQARPVMGMPGMPALRPTSAAA